MALVAGCGGGSSPNQEDSVTESEHAVIVHLDTTGATDWSVYDVEDQLIEAIDGAGVGEFDGNEIALDGSEVILYAYGPDADALYAAMEPVITTVPKGPKSFTVKRYGAPGADEVRLDL